MVQLEEEGPNGVAWGDGTHPTTALCLEWLSERRWTGHEAILDYGCGTGVLLCAARFLGCGAAVGVDVDDEILEAAATNVATNGLQGVVLTHGRHVIPGATFAPADVVVANILVGALSRPSMVATLSLGCAPGGALCLSGFRANDLAVLRATYAPYFDVDNAAVKEMTVDVDDPNFSGTWLRLVAERFDDTPDLRRSLIDRIAEDAVNG